MKLLLGQVPSPALHETSFTVAAGPCQSKKYTIHPPFKLLLYDAHTSQRAMASPARAQFKSAELDRSSYHSFVTAHLNTHPLDACPIITRMVKGYKEQ